MLTARLTIGVLALQGDFDAHRRRLEELGAKVVLVKKPEQLDEVEGLIIPGGESSTFLKLLGDAGFEKLKDFVRLKPTFGTCAGAILLAKEVENPAQSGLGAIDIGIRRNAYGRQIDSSIREGRFRGSPIEMVFIRAPKISRVGDGVEVRDVVRRDQRRALARDVLDALEPPVEPCRDRRPKDDVHEVEPRFELRHLSPSGRFSPMSRRILAIPCGCSRCR